MIGKKTNHCEESIADGPFSPEEVKPNEAREIQSSIYTRLDI
jgi:hypothetical protein